MAVEGVDGYPGGVGCGLDAWYVAVGVERQLQGARLVALDVVAEQCLACVLLACAGVLVGVGVGGLLPGAVGALCSCLPSGGGEGEVALGHEALVVAHPYELSRVGGEGECAVERELLFAHPVGHAVDDAVALAVGGHLALGVVVEQLDEVDVAFAHEGHLLAVGAPHGCLLGSALAEGLEAVVGHRIYIIGGGEGAPVDGLGVGLYEYAPLVGADDVAVDAVDGGSACCLCVEEHGCLPACAEVALDDLASLCGYLGVAGGVECLDGCHGLRAEVAGGDVLQVETAGGAHGQGCQEYEGDGEYLLHCRSVKIMLFNFLWSLRPCEICMMPLVACKDKHSF